MTADPTPPSDDAAGGQRRQQLPPLLWPALTADEAGEEWPLLLDWVEQLRTRYPHATRLPECWWRHNDLVEALAALRDHERGSFARDAPATAAVDWQRAFRDIEQRIEVWIRRLPCTVPGRGHDEPVTPHVLPDGWMEFIGRDLEARRHRQSE